MLGDTIKPDELADLGWRCLEDEWEFNHKAGFEAKDDDLPDTLRNEGIGPGGALKFDVDAQTIASAKVRFDKRPELFQIKATVKR